MASFGAQSDFVAFIFFTEDFKIKSGLFFFEDLDGVRA
jgi:hypothetical protein